MEEKEKVADSNEYAIFDIKYTLYAVIVRIPVRPHIRKFLLQRFQQPYTLSDRHAIGNYLALLMRSPLKNPTWELHMDRYTEFFDVDVSENRVFSQGLRNVSPHTIMGFNNFCDDLFKDELFKFLNDISFFKITSVKMGIYEFMDKYGMEEGIDVTYDGLKKAYYRHRTDRISA